MLYRVGMSFACLLIAEIALSGSAAAEKASAYRDFGSHAGGPANSVPRGTAVPAGSASARPIKAEQHYSGNYAGGPNNGLSRGNSKPLPVAHRRNSDPAYQYPGSYSGGPANGFRR